MFQKKMLVMLLMIFVGMTTVMAKDLRTVIFKVEQMKCENCERKVKNNIKFEKGLKKLSTDLEEKTVTITYDADKTSIENIQEGFRKINYEAVVVEEVNKEEKKK